MFRRVLRPLQLFSLRVLCPVVIGLLMACMPVLAQPAKPQVARLQSQTKLEEVYTDRLRFLQTRMQKLRGIIKRAQKAQQKIRDEKPYLTEREKQKALQQWQNIKRSARKMLMEIQKTIRVMESRSLPKPSPPVPPATRAHLPVAKNVLLTRLDGEKERMAQHRGDVVLLHFWATWCRPCVKEMPSLQRLYQQFRAKDFTLLAVSLDVRKKDLKRFGRRNGLRFPVYFDPGRVVYQQIVGGLEVLPRSFLIDKKGRIVQSYAGARHLASPSTIADIRRLLARN